MISTIVLIGFGFATIFSIELSRGSENVFLQKQAIALGIGLAACALASTMNYHAFRHYARGLYLGGIALLILVFFLGRTLNGSTGWFVVGGFAFQPVELMKVALMVALALYFSERAKRRFGVVGTNYKLNAGKLAPGKYSWLVSTVYKGKTYSKSGYFIVDDIQLEQNNSSANHSTLKQLSIQSNGKYRFLKEYEKTLTEIAARNDITAVEYEEKVFLSLIDLAWLMALLLILLSLEWFTRRYMGTY